ncbi:MAG: ABC transporter permease [Eubacterium sp.]|nr:ABC transporter permease [Eubacterium sp.]
MSQKKNKNFIWAIVLTVAGFSLSLLESLNIPVRQEVDQWPFRYLLGMLILLHLLYALIAFLGGKTREDFVKKAQFRFAMGLVLGIWDFLSTKMDILPLPFFPGPAQVTAIFVEDFDFIFVNTLYSLRLFLVGFLGGILLGVGTGILIGWFRRFHYWTFPIIKITGVIPAVAWMPFALTLLPNSFFAGAFLIAICAWFPVAFTTSQGMKDTPKIYYEVASTLGGKNAYKLFKVALPNAIPNIFNGISTANGLAFTTLVVSEMMGAEGGLGYYINWAKAWSSYDKVYVAIVIMAILFSLIMKLISFIENYLLRWKRGIVA